MKKFVNDPKQFVPEMLAGLAKANPGKLEYVPEYNLIKRTDSPRPDKVSIVQGSGSGHEPAHVMIVGPGMLDAACPGDVFAAPPVDYVTETTKLMAKAVGAAAENGADLEEVVRIGQKVNSVTRTMGVALTSCTPPAKGSTLFELGDDEIEMGVGIHGEPGRRRQKISSADEIVAELLDAIVPDLPFTSGDKVALMVNGLGGTPISELYILFGSAFDTLASQGIEVTRSYVGEYCTSLDMAGASITLVRLDDEIEELLAAPAEVPLRTF